MRLKVEPIVKVEVVPTRYCKPFNMEIEVETCRTRVVAIRNQFDREGIRSLTKEQRKCHECSDTVEQELEIEGNDDSNSGGAVMSNGLSVLNESLFDSLKRLSDPALEGAALENEIDRSRAIAEIGKQVISTGRLTLDVIKTVSPGNIADFLKLEDKSSK
ncbi:MAG: hypothetical protein JRE23_00130 [Deltaproteobacteria bacterium]|nr:hypothetical protein [Deltaproteobacteria bacterium]